MLTYQAVENNRYQIVDQLCQKSDLQLNAALAASGLTALHLVRCVSVFVMSECVFGVHCAFVCACIGVCVVQCCMQHRYGLDIYLEGAAIAATTLMHRQIRQSISHS